MAGGKRIKYPFAVACIIVSISLAYIAFYYASELTAKVYREERDISESKYPYELTVSLRRVKEGQLSQALSLFCVPDMIVSLCGLNLYVDSNESVHWCKMYVQPPPQSSYPIVSGRMPEPSAQEGNQIVLGISWKKYTYQRDGRDYIRVCGDEYLVSAYVAAADSAIYDNLMLLFWDFAGEETRRTEEEFAGLFFGVKVQLQSNYLNVFSWLSEQQSFEELLEEPLSPVQGDAEFYFSEVPVGNYRAYTYLLYGFCLVLVYMALDFWIYQRKREFVILRLNGYSRLRLTGLVGRELFVMMSAVSIFLFLLQVLLGMINEKSVFAVGSLWNLLEMVVFLLVTFIILMIRPLY
nr:hypothetical protein [Lachnospiraceae bacterium]